MDREIVVKRTITITQVMPVEVENEYEALKYEHSIMENRLDFLQWFSECLEMGETNHLKIDIAQNVRSQPASGTSLHEAEDLKEYWTDGDGSKPLAVD